MKSIKEILETEFKESIETKETENYIVKNFFKRIDEKVEVLCNSNRKLTVNVSKKIYINNVDKSTYEIFLRAETVYGAWVEINFYTLTEDEINTIDYKVIEKKLIKMWEVANETKDKLIKKTNKLIFESHSSPDFIGEKLRNYSFKKEVGCYSCFELIEEFEKIEPIENIEHLILMFDLDDKNKLIKNSEEFIKEIKNNKYIIPNTDIDLNRVSMYLNKDNFILVAWYWDGDGILYFSYNGKSLVNTDCKKSYGWKEL